MRMVKKVIAMVVGAISVGATVGSVVPLVTSSHIQSSDNSLMRQGSVAVQKDVSTGWNYSCPENTQCLQAWSSAPQVSVSFTFDKTKAEQAYARIVKWADFQLDYLTNVQKDYQKIVWSEDIFNNYYLPPHEQAGQAKPQWQAIYASLNPLVRQAYTTKVQGEIEALLSANLNYSLAYDTSLKSDLAYGLDQKLNWGTLLDQFLGKNVLLQKASLKQKILDNLFAALAMPDLQTQFNVLIAAAMIELQDSVQRLYSNYDSLVKTMFQASAIAKEELGTSDKRLSFDKELDSLMAISTTTLARLPETTLNIVQRLLAGKWNAQAVYNAVSDTNLLGKYNAFAFPETPWNNPAQLPQRMTEFMNASAKLEAVGKTAAYFPNDVQGSREISKYGPRAAALIFDAVGIATNFANHTNDLNPSLSQLVQQQNQIKNSALFKTADLQTYEASALESLWAGQPIADEFTNLLTTAVERKLWDEKLLAVVNRLQTERLSADLVKEALVELDRIAHPPKERSQAAFGALLGLGAVSGLLAAGAGYPLIRGFVAKRKYGVSFFEYFRTRIALGAVVAAGAIVAVTLIVLAVSGVV